MKKSGLLIVMLVVSTFSVFAQNEAPKVRIGIIATPGVSWMQFDKAKLINEGAALTFGYGLQTEFKITKNIYFVTGLTQNNFSGNVSFKDSVNLEYSYDVDGEAVFDTAQITERKYNFNSIELPISLKLKTPEIGYFTYFVMLGLNANIIYKSTAKENKIILAGNTADLPHDLTELDANDETNWYRLGSNVSLGFEYNFIGNTSLVVSANWSKSFSDILKDKPKNLMYKSNGNPFLQSGKLDFASLTVGVIF